MTRARDLASTALNNTVSTTELGYLDGVTSSVQTQLDAKAPSSTAVTLTGTQTLTNKTLTNPVIASVVNNTLTTAKGDLVTATAASTPAALAVGNNGESLVADSSTSTGLRYSAGNPITNPVLNSAMQVWQRGTTSSSITTAATYTADRWASVSGASTAMVVSRQATGDTTNLPNIQYCSRVQRTSGQTGISVLYFAQSIESINSIPFAGKTVTLSFYARKGANYSQATSIVSAYLQTGTGTDQNILSGGLTGAVNAIAQDATLTTTWQRFTYTGTIGATATQLGMFFSYTPVGTAGAADYFEITGVQIDIGSVALPFRTNGGTFQGELAACQRYYQSFIPTDNYQDFFVGSSCDQTTYCRYPIIFPVVMRIAPTASTTGTANNYGNLVASGFAAANQVPSFGNLKTSGGVIFVFSSAITTGQGTCMRNGTVTPTNWLTFSAEL